MPSHQGILFFFSNPGDNVPLGGVMAFACFGVCKSNFFLFVTLDFVKVTIRSRFHVGSTINFVHYVHL